MRELTAKQIEEGVARMREGIRLFEYACNITLAGLRHQYPDASEELIQQAQ